MKRGARVSPGALALCVSLLASAALAASPGDALRFAVADRVFGARDGLPAEQVLAVLQDHAGALWVGTTAGLARLSGPEIETFGLAQGLPSWVVTALEEGGDGTLFAGTDAGLARFDG